jgi:hypothetical protein
MLALPRPRGPLSDALLARLREEPGALEVPTCLPQDALCDEDLQLALTVCYELHYRGLPGVDERWEWEPSLLAVRRELEGWFESQLRAALPPRPSADARRIDVALRELAAADDGVSLSRHLERAGTLAEFREFAIHRSIYQLKEADPHAWAIPRLHGRAKAALVEIEIDEYGGGRPERMHAALFAKALRALELDDRYGAYVDAVPAITLATVNLMSMFGLHRRLRGAIVGHLAMFEMTSSVPNRRYSQGLRRLGVSDPEVLEFFDEHVEADAVHESVAAVDLAGGLLRSEAALAQDVLFGARALLHVEERWAEHLLASWEAGASSLRDGSSDAAAALAGSGT